MTASTDLSALIGSRICHDLISPLGAIGNGVELMAMSGGQAGPEMDLISESVASANARIKLFRIAFGPATKGQMVSCKDVLTIVSDFTSGGRHVLDWHPKQDLQRQDVKLLFLLLQCFETAMPRGGKITVSNVGDSWAIIGESNSMDVRSELWELLESDITRELEPAQVHFALAPLAAKSAERHLSVEKSDAVLRVRF